MTAALLLLTTTTILAPQSPDAPLVVYEVSLDAPSTQVVAITMTVPCAGEETVDVMLPTWRPGRYSILDPVSTVRGVHATSGSGQGLEVEPVAKSTWRIETGGAPAIRVHYDVYANSIGDRTRHVDDTHAFLSGSSVFMYTPRLRSAPAHVVIDAPADWGIACGLDEERHRVLHADDYDVLVDSPIEVGLHDTYGFDVDGVPHELVVWPPGVELDREQVLADLAKIVTEQAAIFGRKPYQRYVFLVHVGAGGGGTEHLNSTIMQTSRSALEGNRTGGSAYRGFLGLVAHEFFHTWNVKQLRPAGLHPYDYQRENYTDLLWFAEGGTSYYGDLSLVRAGLTKPDDHLRNLARSIASMRNRPGARVQSAAASSFDAWTKASRSSLDDVNTEVSFYSKGLLVFLLLDMEVRGRTENRVGLDDVMRTMFERYPLSGPGYTSADLVAALDELTGTSFEEFFERYVDGTEQLPFEDALLTAGLELRFEPSTSGGEQERSDAEEGGAGGARPEPPMKAYLGLRLRNSGSGASITSVLADGPAYSSGLMPGDEIVAMNGRRLRSSDLDARLKRLEPGDEVTLHYLRRDELREIKFTLTGVPDGSWKIERVKEPSDLQKATYASWIGHPWPETRGDAQEEHPPADTGVTR